MNRSAIRCVFVALTAGLLAAGCGGEGTPAPLLNVQAISSAVPTVGIPGTITAARFVADPLPTGSAPAPTVTVQPGSAAPGQTVTLHIDAPQAADAIYIGNVTHTGYYNVDVSGNAPPIELTSRAHKTRQIDLNAFVNSLGSGSGDAQTTDVDTSGIDSNTPLYDVELTIAPGTPPGTLQLNVVTVTDGMISAPATVAIQILAS
jgi:hypothetical protein